MSIEVLRYTFFWRMFSEGRGYLTEHHCKNGIVAMVYHIDGGATIRGIPFFGENIF